MNIGQKIKQRREELKLTQSGLAKRMNKSPQVISNWERGYTPTINYDDLTKLAEVLGVEVNWLLGADGKEGTIPKAADNSAKKEADSKGFADSDQEDISVEEAEAIALIRRSWSKLSPEQRQKRLDILKNFTKLTDDRE